MTMRRSPRRPLILKRRKLPFHHQQNNEAVSKSTAVSSPDSASPDSASSLCVPDSLCFLDHPSLAHTQLVVVPKSADLQNVIGALTAKGKESGPQGPNKFILLSGNSGNNGIGSFPSTASAERILSVEDADVKHVKPLGKDLECGPLDDSLTNIQWLGRMSTSSLEPRLKPTENKENLNASQVTQTGAPETSLKPSISERPPYSYMAMIQFAINSKASRRMTLREIYHWIEEHFPFFREVAKPGWKNSIRHNLSLHDMFIRETSADGKVSYWTIRPEANRCLTLDQVYKTELDPLTVSAPSTMLYYPNQQQKRVLQDSSSKTPFGKERKMKPLLPRTDSYLVPIQLPLSSTVLMPLSSAQNKQSYSRGAKKVRIAPKISVDDSPGQELKEESVEVLIKSPPKAAPRGSSSSSSSSSSRRKQRLELFVHDEPLLLCYSHSFIDSGVISDSSSSHQELMELSPSRGETPAHLASSTPSKASSTLDCAVVPELWKVTPVSKRSQTVLDFSPIRTPGGPAVTPHHDYTSYSFSSTPFKDLPLFSSPRELLQGHRESPRGSPRGPPHHSGCSRELLRASQSPAPSGPAPSGSTPQRSLAEGLVLDTMNDSLSKILVDISFSGLEDDELGMGHISWSEIIPQLK